MSSATVESTQTREFEDNVDQPIAKEAKPERVPKDTAAELERVKQIIGHQFGIDMRSPGQIAQAKVDEDEAQEELERQQKEEREQAEREQREADEAEEQQNASQQKALTKTSSVSRSSK